MLTGFSFGLPFLLGPVLVPVPCRTPVTGLALAGRVPVWRRIPTRGRPPFGGFSLPVCLASTTFARGTAPHGASAFGFCLLEPCDVPGRATKNALRSTILVSLVRAPETRREPREYRRSQTGAAEDQRHAGCDVLFELKTGSLRKCRGKDQQERSCCMLLGHASAAFNSRAICPSSATLKRNAEEMWTRMSSGCQPLSNVPLQLLEHRAG